ncbi:MAG: DNA topoisomerase, partial [Minisyncoccia bacterium]
MSNSNNKKLIIVESPTKAKTISKFLDKNYVLMSSFGHLRDLPKSKLGVDVENDFKPEYIISPKSKKQAAELVKAAKNSDEVILASDEDREGEAIAWHIAQILKLGEFGNGKNVKKYTRIVFHEITKSAIEVALANPRKLDMDLVDAQQARRVLDRLVGYKLSPLLWKKIRYGLSAGRVQSVAVRLIAEREEEINKFKPEEYWSIESEVKKLGNWEIGSEEFEKNKFRARLIKINNKTVG